MIDKHPQSKYFAIVEAVAGTKLVEELDLGNPGTPISNRKFLAIEILRINAIVTIPSTVIAGGRTTGQLTDSDGNVIATFECQTALTTSGGTQISSHQVDLTDGQGNGVLLAKNPKVTIQSSGAGAVQAFIGEVLWRYRAVKSTELVALA